MSSEEDQNSEFQNVIEGVLTKKSLIKIVDTRSQDQLRNKGFGDKEDDDYLLETYEALYLLYLNKLVITNGSIDNFGSLLKHVLKYDKEIVTRFLVYRDLRSRGYVVKEGFGFGADFRVYERGEYEKKRAKYVVFCINEGINVKVGEVSKNVREIETMGKNAIAAVVERRGEVIYYKLTNMKFKENKKQETTLTLKERK
ncbi:MAG: tRNA-intron lyase [Nitrososphaeraceae archaeon]|jgi:tRNA-intron endonuclease, archaea type|nr:tRNA-intron lyase [Nitrososphaeraceae archaeon]MDW0143354.1 tRNA-intron lyase [Nitrososphaeraceae archaeon]MDW0151226.1 tRNA-intron lyase [Nitrososphaeraceae archaeon]MDW0153786.1 tRNA-intron lyase [Nitrososphaeraceae archaeon]MDW0157467.1 tRNA-intron lyase [Nitrososphaeraceae archaeon]